MQLIVYLSVILFVVIGLIFLRVLWIDVREAHIRITNVQEFLSKRIRALEEDEESDQMINS